MLKIKNYINGELVPPASKKYLKNICPSTGENYSMIPDSDENDVNQAVAVAQQAFKSWNTTPKQERSDILMKLADEIEKHSDVLIAAESKDNGKPEWLARSVDIPRAPENFRFFATAILHFNSEIHEMDGQALNYTLRQPIGVAGCISPWNLPLYLLTWKVAPALAAGNTVVAKPSEVTPMTAFIFSKICQKVGLPNGILNIVHGTGKKAGDALARHPDVPIISFTGGTETGRKNLENISDAFGCDIIEFHPNRHANRILSRRTFEEIGQPSWYVDSLIYTFPYRMAMQLGIKLLVYGEDVDYTYGGTQMDEKSSAMYQSSNEVVKPFEKNWVDGNDITLEHMQPAIPPSVESC